MAKNKKRVKPEEVSNVALNTDEQKKFEQDIREKRKQTGSTLKPGIVRLSHIPWGFFEHDIKDYFKQFGTVSRVRLSRSKRTGNCRGYAYIEFASEDVARIAAETMNNYLMFGKLLKCRFMDRVHPKLMKGANRKFRKPMTHIQDAKRHNQIKTEIQQARGVRRFLGAYKKKMNKLVSLGINYELDGIITSIHQQICINGAICPLLLTGAIARKNEVQTVGQRRCSTRRLDGRKSPPKNENSLGGPDS
ncbi:hypothetical protein ACJMK2_022542 [Sinanodonta woodiana]|uniref:RRM domain-containing protein n=1 Tax=Sinanodonta woodiana TaxID=1069815 RepID=A0ABD3TKE9_SINWO